MISLPSHTERSVSAMDDSRNHILQTALKLFLEKSYEAVTFRELVEKTGFSKGAFFYYFKNKQEIFEAVIDMYVNQSATVDFTQLSKKSLRDFLDGYFAPRRPLSASHYSLIFEALRIIPDFKSKVNRHEDNAMAAWISIMAAARKNKEIKTVLSDEQLAQLFIDAGHGVVIHLVMTGNTTAIEKKALAAWNNLYLLIKA